MSDDQLGVFLGLLALIFVLLPHWLDPVILWRERLDRWEESQPSPHRLFWSAIASLIAIVFAALGALAFALIARR